MIAQACTQESCRSTKALLAMLSAQQEAATGSRCSPAPEQSRRTRAPLQELVAHALASICAALLSGTNAELVVQDRWQQADAGPCAPAAANEVALQRDAERLTAALQAVAQGTQARTFCKASSSQLYAAGDIRGRVVLQEGLRAW